MKIVLASSSPRRKELMELLGVPYEVFVPQDEEVLLEDAKPEQSALQNACRKAEWVCSHGAFPPDTVFIGVDTIVFMGGTILEKPKDKDDLLRMLALYSNRHHYVASGMCVMTRTKKIELISTTKVHIKPLSEKEKNAYAQRDEWRDKAGGYGIQGAFAKFVTHIEGNYFNVMGMDVSALYDVLKNEFHVFGEPHEA